MYTWVFLQILNISALLYSFIIFKLENIIKTKGYSEIERKTKLISKASYGTA